MSGTLIIYSTREGQTLKICERMQQVMQTAGAKVALMAIEELSESALLTADCIVVGASIHYGKHDQAVYDFVEQYQMLLDERDNAFFSVNVVARKPNRATPDNNIYLKKFLKQISWKPKRLAVFAGRLDYQAYRWLDRQMIRLIMWMTKGPTAPDTVVEYTNWDQVEQFARELIPDA